MVNKNKLQIDVITTINYGIDRLEKLIKDKEKKRKYDNIRISTNKS